MAKFEWSYICHLLFAICHLKFFYRHPDTWNLTFLGEEDGCVSCRKRVLRGCGFILQGEI
jgi:hypothetical protein